MKRSVAIIGTRGYPSYYGGFETAIRRLAPYLVERGWDVTVYGRTNSTKDNDPARDQRVKSIVMPGIESKSFSTLSYGFTSTIHAVIHKPDVALVMNTANGYFLPFLAARKVPSLVNVDGIEWDRAKWGKLAKKVFHVGALMTAKFGTRMVYDAEAIATRWRKEFKVDGDFIPYGGDVPGALPIEDWLTHRGYVLAVARFVPENTVPQFMDAAAQLAKSWPVVLVGSSGYGGELDNRAAELASELENFHWLGHISDDAKLHSLWQHAGVYFHGHSVGGTNPALVQAMACGAPVVARDTIYNREVLQSGAVFVPPESSAIAAAIAELMQDRVEQDKLALMAQKRAASEYSWEGVCAAYESALLRLIAQNQESAYV
ncbi:glycosyltransferase [Arthrobacter sp. ISL-30]|uniref:glycosyltransferase n=1 Tax=Arthrobacter sp. ISL-30 TaxID=2819109 RepID=UPI001BEA4485|nr:glycosyltransferase [Arthrobacter sp. ISL-30]MBT2515738.1 glycosyltransferase [Arthrobacter sp. ISL-30]